MISGPVRTWSGPLDRRAWPPVATCAVSIDDGGICAEIGLPCLEA
jgi:hypothetical protein